MDISNAFERLSSGGIESLPGIAIMLICEAIGIGCGFIFDSIMKSRERKRQELAAMDGAIFIDGQWVKIIDD